MIHIDNQNSTYQIQGSFHEILSDVGFVLAEIGEQVPEDVFAKMLADMTLAVIQTVESRKKENKEKK